MSPREYQLSGEHSSPYFAPALAALGLVLTVYAGARVDGALSATPRPPSLRTETETRQERPAPTVPALASVSAPSAPPAVVAVPAPPSAVAAQAPEEEPEEAAENSPRAECGPLVVNFPRSESQIPEPLQQRLRALGRWGNEHGRVRFVVLGHADGSGSELTNLRLSQERARAVAALLENDGAGVAPRNLTVQALGAFAPAEGTEERSARNRRVEVQLRSVRRCPTRLLRVENAP